MRRNRSLTRATLFLAAAGGALAILAASPARAAHCSDDWRRPYVCEVELWATRSGQRPVRVHGGHSLPVAAGESFDLEARATDQTGRAYPQERLRLGVEPDRSCGGRAEIKESGPGRHRITVGRERGNCRIWIWMPGNLNLEWAIDLDVGSSFRAGYSSAEAEELTRRLYAALLGREPDPSGMSTSTGEIRAGRLDKLVESMQNSSEFSVKAAKMTPAERLEQIYRGLLGRSPDAAGSRSYLSFIQRGQHAAVVIELLTSEEFEGVLRQATQ